MILRKMTFLFIMTSFRQPPYRARSRRDPPSFLEGPISAAPRTGVRADFNRPASSLAAGSQMHIAD
jgi:hypothetical protein